MNILFKGNIVILAYSCEPGVGGEHEVGWKISKEFGKICPNKIHVVTRKSNQEKIERTLNRDINFHFIEADNFIKYKPKGGFSYLYYVLWQLKASSYINKNFDSNDHIHLLTFGNIHLPSFLFLLKNSYSLGPMGGGAFVETALLITPSYKERVKSFIYKIINSLAKFNPFFRYSNYRSTCIITRTSDTQKILSAKSQLKATNILETGIDDSNIKSQYQKGNIKNFVNVSRFIESKNIEVAIKTFNHLNELNNNQFKYTLIGDGPLFKELESRYSSKNVYFAGKMNHVEVKEVLKKSDVMLTCTVKEGGSHAIYEAMTAGCLVACYDISGMQDFPPENASIKYKPTKDVQVNIEQFAKQIHIQLSNRNQLIESARQCLSQQTWEIKAKHIYEFIKKSI